MAEPIRSCVNSAGDDWFLLAGHRMKIFSLISYACRCFALICVEYSVNIARTFFPRFGRGCRSHGNADWQCTESHAIGERNRQSGWSGVGENSARRKRYSSSMDSANDLGKIHNVSSPEQSCNTFVFFCILSELSRKINALIVINLFNRSALRVFLVNVHCIDLCFLFEDKKRKIRTIMWICRLLHASLSTAQLAAVSIEKVTQTLEQLARRSSFFCRANCKPLWLVWLHQGISHVYPMSFRTKIRPCWTSARTSNTSPPLPWTHLARAHSDELS